MREKIFRSLFVSWVILSVYIFISGYYSFFIPIKTVCEPEIKTIENGRAIAFEKQIEKESGRTDSICMYSYSYPPWAKLLYVWTNYTGTNADVGKLDPEKDIYRIRIEKSVLDDFPDEALKAVIAHEIGHICHKFYLSKKKTRDDFEEAQADSFAIKFAGKDALVSAALLLGESREEINFRINEAQKILLSELLRGGK